MAYRKQAGTLALESAAFGAGRFVATTSSSGTTYRPNYFITDHLGSVRLVVDSDGTVLECNDYYPFGLRWNDPTSFRSDNRYGYNGKEWQGFLKIPYNDHGVRQLDPRYRMSWNGPDPIADETPDINPFAFCNNNPIRYVDLTGLSAESTEPDPSSSTPIEPVVVVAKRPSNPLVNLFVYIRWSAEQWGELINGATGNVKTTSEQNVQTGYEAWHSIALGYGVSKLNFSGIKSKASKNIKTSPKIRSQMSRRGWTDKKISKTINTPFTTRVARNRATNNPATAYFNKDGSYIVMDNMTEEIIQISNSLDKNWIPDQTIINPYKPH